MIGITFLDALNAEASTADPDLGRLTDIVEAAAADAGCVLDVIEALGDHPHTWVQVALVSVLARAAWNWEADAGDIRASTLEMARRSASHGPDLVIEGLATVLAGLNARDELAPLGAEGAVVGALIVRGLCSAEVAARAGCVDLLVHLVADGVLNVLISSEDVINVRESLRGLDPSIVLDRHDYDDLLQLLARY